MVINSAKTTYRLDTAFGQNKYLNNLFTLVNDL